ncbi:uncharacterized protein LOC120260809 [Dioscorea cayenensis subsp. rotundata]|uniref:Uncharacterized protein LOC120260809 n=1 Tax=Dioscorea cayennensis subsp. rotundata TaxID=55577 RepID=A0AB40BCE5_DIOCR|nr:uncharacterized protein LOC120260809 [Dioscorea cayenensis subsp. rotundata]
MMGTSIQFGRVHGDDRFYNAAKARRNPHHYPFRPRSSASSSSGAGSSAASTVSNGREPENRTGSEPQSKATAVLSSPSGPVAPSRCNLDRFLESTVPSVPAQYLSKTRMRGRRTCDVEFPPYFALADLWESFKEWSAYGAGVPLLLNGSDSVVQYYVPYLSGIQLYTESSSPAASSSRPGEESDGDNCRDSSSDGSSDYEHQRCMKYSRNWNQKDFGSAFAFRMDRVSIRDNNGASHEEFSSDDGETGNFQGHLLFEYLEHNPPFTREPLADKISDLACRCPELKTLKSSDLSPASWMSVAWYPIYRIPTGPTLQDLDACFLTFHYLSTPMKAVGNAPGPIVTHPQGVDGVPKISLPSFGLSCYKLKGSIWTATGVYESQFPDSLFQAADDWLRRRQVNHPDYQFFASRGVIPR